MRTPAAILRDRIRALLHPPVYEPDVARIIRERVRSGDVCADVGANVGYLTRVMAESTGSDGLVVAFEPWPDNVRRLQKLKRLHATVEVQDCAVSDGAADELWLHAGRNRSAFEWNIMGRDMNGVATPAELRVRAVSLDGFFADRDAPSFVKVDVEGAEGLVIAGMRALLAKARPVVLIEFHIEEGWDARRILFDAGYELRTLDGASVSRDAERVYQCLALPPA